MVFVHKPGPVLPKLQDITTDSGRTYILEDGTKLPSITTVLGYSKRHIIQNWRRRVGEEKANQISSRAGSRGTSYHSLVESYIQNKELPKDLDPFLLESFKVARPALDRINSVMYMEAPVFSKTLGVAGRVDLVAEFDNVLSIIDHKTSLKPKREEWIQDYFEQETAYSLMLAEMIGLNPKQIVTIISVDGYTEPQIFIKSPKNYVGSLLTKIKEYKENVY